MNDSTREKLSAYLDGALSDTERRAVEVEVSRSEELRLELEALRAVSAAVKGLPKEELPAGFRARLDARIAREGAAPERDYFILPPAYRPLAFALSTAVVALVVWDRTVPRQEMISPRAGWDSETVAVKSAADAPPSVDVSGRVSSFAAGAKPDDETSDKKENATNDKARAPSTLGKNLSAPGKPLEFAESAAPAAAPPSAFEGSTAEPVPGAGGTFTARNEEERSAINERLYRGFEEEKKRMGIARIAEKDSEADNLPLGGRDLMALQASPEAPRLDSGAIGSSRAAAPLRKAKAARSAPVVKALSLKSAEALAAAWAAAALPGEPPAIDFTKEMALFLAGPSGCGIVDVQQRKKFIVVLYKESGFEDPSARVRAAALSPKPIVVKPAE